MDAKCLFCGRKVRNLPDHFVIFHRELLDRFPGGVCPACGERMWSKEDPRWIRTPQVLGHFGTLSEDSLIWHLLAIEAL